MFEMSATIQNAQGIHCRPSAEIVKMTQHYPGTLLVVSDRGQYDPRSVMNLLLMGLEQGDRVILRVSGPDEERFCRDLAAKFETHFDFPPRGQEEAAPTS